MTKPKFDYKNMKLLVTGGAGFIGSHLVDTLLNQNHKVVCVDDLSLGKLENVNHQIGNKDFRFIKLDILNLKRLDEVFKKNRLDCIFHLAANSDIRESLKYPSADLYRTFMTTYNILMCMAHANVKKIVFTSSSAVYGESNDLLSEDTSLFKPISFYGASKLASEAFISAFCENYNIQAWILRFPNVVGERATHGVVFDFIKQLRKNPKKLIILGNGTQKKPYVYVKDLIDGIIFVWKNSVERLNCFNLGVTSSTTVKNIAKIVIQEMGCEKVKLVYTGGDRGWIGDIPKYAYDLSRINKLGWKANMTSDEAIRYTMKVILKTAYGEQKQCRR